jgi:hypothetical protein
MGDDRVLSEEGISDVVRGMAGARRLRESHEALRAKLAAAEAENTRLRKALQALRPYSGDHQPRCMAALSVDRELALCDCEYGRLRDVIDAALAPAKRKEERDVCGDRDPVSPRRCTRERGHEGGHQDPAWDDVAMARKEECDG